MRFSRISKAVALGAAATLALSACAATTGSSNSSGSSSASESAATGGEVRVVEVNGFSSFNANSAKGNVDINSKIAYATQSGFNYIDNEFNIVKNDKFGTYEKVSDDPLTIKYTINEGVKWSDGTQIGADDLMLTWAITSGYFDDATLDADGAVTKGTQYFQYAGSTSGLNDTEVPEIGEDGRSITLKYNTPYADWELAISTMLAPAHVVAEKAGLEVADLTKIFTETAKGDPAKPVKPNAELKKAADFWNTGFDTTTLPSDKSLYLSSGPFIADSIEDGKSMTLKRNPDYNWGPMPKVDSIVVRYIGDAQAQVAALKNGEVDIIAPQASADTLEQLEALGDAATVDTFDQLSYDHLDLNFNGPFKEENVREAFLKTIPRQQIVDSIIKKLKPEATPLNSQLFVPANAAYEESAANNGSSAYGEPDIEGAKELLAGATPTVRIMYNKDNPNRVDSYTLIAKSATEAGFKVVDGGLAGNAWGAALGGGTYDAVIFGWVSSGVGVSGVPQIFGSGSSSNFNKFSDKEADKLIAELIKTTDKAEQDKLQVQIDKLIWDSKYGLPLFQSVGVDAYSSNIDGVKPMPNQTGVWWNFWDWSVKS
ncbi:ABC transporter family substrate-binding protein [Neomicrococcus aestuarii]|uniref:ABC transporter substrate-binding protein n=1 Tax=Neomicrococcus aestuarii TaxID=556325 RepID=A0A1L2ZRE4_9MICC|nr:ABC transporter family substrate-binding protein [Neomicrococcus aestuarii]APF41571.1 ABC transporter substrate-binding protein [Neomicrococcus aestuarii]